MPTDNDRISTKDMAKLAKVSTTAYNNWFKYDYTTTEDEGEKKNKRSFIPRLVYLRNIAYAFGVTIEWLLGLEAQNQKFVEVEQKKLVFEEFGFSPNAYKKLSEVKSKFRNTKEIMSGINVLLENASLSDFTIENEDGEKETSIYVGGILGALNRYFSLYKDGAYGRISAKELNRLKYLLRNKGFDPAKDKVSDYIDIYIHNELPYALEAAHLFEIQKELTNCKANWTINYYNELVSKHPANENERQENAMIIKCLELALNYYKGKGIVELNDKEGSE